VTGNKAEDKMYYRHTGFPGGIYETNFKKMQQRFPGRVLEKAVKGMLPKGPLGYAMLKKMKCYAGAYASACCPAAESSGTLRGRNG
jgi:large subunit ribosomal protein L13